MTRLAHTHRKKTQTGLTILGTLPIDLAPKERERLLGGLEAFVNVGDRQQDYRAFLTSWPGFWLGDVQAKKEADFRQYRDTLRKLWSGSLQGEQSRLSAVAYLLGLITFDEVDSLFMTGPDALLELMLHRPTEPTWGSALTVSQWTILPLWGSAEVRFLARGDLEKALWVLFRESWRAKTCGQCKKYFIAGKPAQTYCSPACNGAAKKGQRLTWWNRVGKVKRAQRNSRKAKARGE